MSAERGISATMTPASKTPRTERGRKTLRLLLDSAAAEFGEKGFHDSSVVSITQRAGVALGSFYTYFDSKDSLFRALVRDMSAQVRQTVGPVMAAEPDRLDGERKGLARFLEFVREHKELYRIIDEAEFVDPASYRQHYEDTVNGYLASLKDAAVKGQLRDDVEEVHAWAIVGMNVFLGLRYGVMGEDRDVTDVANIAADLLTNGLKR
jgi:AcrR family transcriptional regulator